MQHSSNIKSLKNLKTLIIVMVVEDIINNFFGKIESGIPENYKLFIILLFFTILIIIYAIFVFYFYKILARKNIINLNLGQYAGDGAAVKFFAFIFYIIEYIIIMPLLTLLWFGFLAVFLIILSKQGVATILMISAALVAAVRVTAFINEDLSKDLAKLLPFTLLGLFIIQPDFFNLSEMIGRISDIPSLFYHIPYYLIFIVALETIMRLADFIGHSVGTEEAETERQQPIENI